MFSLEGQVAFVTGAARGIGLRVAELLQQAGARVVRADYAEWDPEPRELDAGTWGVRLDVTDSQRVRDVVAQAVDQLGRIDILINNAGITRDGLLVRMKDEDWNRVMATNLNGVFHVTREVIPRMMRQRYGRVVNISSVVGVMGNAGQANYASSKAGVVGFTKAVAREVASRNITVNALAPGYIDTSMTKELGEEAKQDLVSMIPLGRIGTVEDVGFGVLFLVSREAGYITGHVLNINGGMYM